MGAVCFSEILLRTYQTTTYRVLLTMLSVIQFI